MSCNPIEKFQAIHAGTNLVVDHRISEYVFLLFHSCGEGNPVFLKKAAEEEICRLIDKAFVDFKASFYIRDHKMFADKDCMDNILNFLELAFVAGNSLIVEHILEKNREYEMLGIKLVDVIDNEDVNISETKYRERSFIWGGMPSSLAFEAYKVFFLSRKVCMWNKLHSCLLDIYGLGFERNDSTHNHAQIAMIESMMQAGFSFPQTKENFEKRKSVGSLIITDILDYGILPACDDTEYPHNENLDKNKPFNLIPDYLFENIGQDALVAAYEKKLSGYNSDRDKYTCLYNLIRYSDVETLQKAIQQAGISIHLPAQSSHIKVMQAIDILPSKEEILTHEGDGIELVVEKLVQFCMSGKMINR